MLYHLVLLLRVKLYDVQQDLGGLVHPLDGGALADAVEVEAAGAEVGAGQALPAQNSAVGAAPDGNLLRGCLLYTSRCV